MPHLTPGQHIHLVGIGGAGLSAIARVLIGQGYRVSGSDRSLNPLTASLAQIGVTVYSVHDATNVTGADALIISSAVAPDHAEVLAAKAAGIPVYKRSDIMADLMVGKQVIAVAGTAGKTTTSAMIAHILIETGKDPSYIIGGVLSTTGQNAAVGKGKSFVVEADEYDNMFLGLRPDIAIITNAEWDHPDFFPTHENMLRSFEQFVDLVPPHGTVICCVEERGGVMLYARSLSKSNRAFWLPYGNLANTTRIENPSADQDGMTFETAADFPLALEEERAFVRLPMYGRHNVLNATAAIWAMRMGEVWNAQQAADALSTFKGTGRRFEFKGEVDGIAVIDDYAHHPMKIRATLQAARSRYPEREIWAVWQPHTYSRTQALWEDFVAAFKDADHVLVTDIYAAREQPIPGVNAADIVAQIKGARFTPTFAEAVAVLEAEVKAPAAVIIMSAGDAPQIGAEFLRRKGKI